MKKEIKTVVAFKRSVAEEIANAATHGVGASWALAGLVLLVLRADGFLGGLPGGALKIGAFVLFAATMFLMFLSSTLYHAIQTETIKKVFKALDHGAIYLFIAGSYTPLCLLILPAPLGIVVFVLEWTAALAGIVVSLFHFSFYKKAEIAVYLVMGWAVTACIPYLGALPKTALVFLASGGLCYTAGVFWYVKKTTRGCHVVWHALVLAGAICHYLAMWRLA